MELAVSDGNYDDAKKLFQENFRPVGKNWGKQQFISELLEVAEREGPLIEGELSHLILLAVNARCNYNDPAKQVEQIATGRMAAALACVGAVCVPPASLERATGFVQSFANDFIYALQEKGKFLDS